MMTLFPLLSFSEQGLYDIINNLGSIAARFIFLPIEEAGYVYFGSTVERGKDILKQKKVSFSFDQFSKFY